MNHIDSQLLGFDETFLVVGGEIEMTVRERVVRLGPGASAYVSGGTPHTFCNPGPEPVRFIVFCSPGGWEEFFRAVAAGDADTITAVSKRFGYGEVSSDDAVVQGVE